MNANAPHSLSCTAVFSGNMLGVSRIARKHGMPTREIRHAIESGELVAVNIGTPASCRHEYRVFLFSYIAWSKTMEKK